MCFFQPSVIEFFMLCMFLFPHQPLKGKNTEGKVATEARDLSTPPHCESSGTAVGV